MKSFLRATVCIHYLSANKSRYMKNLSLVLLIIFAIAAFSCKKTHENSAGNLALLQHKWMLVSHNGEALRYVGSAADYYNFSTDNFLYLYINKNYDTMAYVLLPDNKTLSFYPVVNGVRINLATNYDIKVLDDHRLIIGTNLSLLPNMLDSLKR